MESLNCFYSSSKAFRLFVCLLLLLFWSFLLIVLGRLSLDERFERENHKSDVTQVNAIITPIHSASSQPLSQPYFRYKHTDDMTFTMA